LEVPGVLCKRCNELLGNTADAELAKALEAHRTLLAIEGDRGQLASLRAVDEQGRMVILQPGLLSESAEAAPGVEWIDENTLNINAHTEKQAREMTKAFQRKRSGEDLIVKETNVRKIFPGKMNISMNLNGETFFRPVVRTALVLLAYEGLESVVTLDKAWRYVGGQSAQDCGVKIFFSSKAAPWHDQRLGEVPHRVSVRGNIEASRLEVDVRYFGEFAFCAYIATEISRPFAVAYGVDPTTSTSVRRSDWTREVGDPVNPNSDLIYAWIQVAMDNLITAAEPIGQRALSKWIVVECTKKVLGTNFTGPHTQEQVDAIAKCANEELAFLMARRDAEEVAPNLQAALQEVAVKLRQKSRGALK
jgi:hypothetical protein